VASNKLQINWEEVKETAEKIRNGQLRFVYWFARTSVSM